MGLKHRFSAMVSSEDGMETTSQSLLSAAIKLGRPPNKYDLELSVTQADTVACCYYETFWMTKTGRYSKDLL